MSINETIRSTRLAIAVDKLAPKFGLRTFSSNTTALAQQNNGDCIYLGPDGCTNYANRPAICRKFDCRKFYQKVINGSSELLKLAQEIGGSDDVMNAGKARVRTIL